MIACSKEESTTPPPTKYNVSIALNPIDGGTVSPDAGQFNEGQTVSFIVTPSENYIFKNWSGSDTSSNNPLSLTITSNITLTVNFEKKDTDGDGVTDDLDQCPDTPEGQVVDNNGCSILLYLDPNGVTIKSYEWAEVGDTATVNNITYTVVSEEQLREMIENGDEVSNVCTSKITNMSGLFTQSQFNGDISSWDVSNVTNMDGIFARTPFNGDISSWDVSNVTIMRAMFFESLFDRDISGWDVSSVTDMISMFYGSPFNQDISIWNVSNVTDMTGMFYESQLFNQDLSGWDVTNVINCSYFSLYTPDWTLPKPNFTNCDPN